MFPRGPLKEHMNLSHVGWVGCSIPPPQPMDLRLSSLMACRDDNISLIQITDRLKTGQNQTRTKTRANNIFTFQYFPQIYELSLRSFLMISMLLSSVIFNKFFNLNDEMLFFKMTHIRVFWSDVPIDRNSAFEFIINHSYKYIHISVFVSGWV